MIKLKYFLAEILFGKYLDAFFISEYSLKKNLNSRYFIVDHKLRNESTYEAHKVKKILKSLKINSQVLTWKGKKPTSNIQSLARSKRYELLFSKCKKLKISNLIFFITF